MRTNRFIHLVMAMLFSLGIVSLAACNTIEGAGEDVEEAGKAIEDAAEDAS